MSSAFSIYIINVVWLRSFHQRKMSGHFMELFFFLSSKSFWSENSQQLTVSIFIIWVSERNVGDRAKWHTNEWTYFKLNYIASLWKTLIQKAKWLLCSKLCWERHFTWIVIKVMMMVFQRSVNKRKSNRSSEASLSEYLFKKKIYRLEVCHSFQYWGYDLLINSSLWGFNGYQKITAPFFINFHFF